MLWIAVWALRFWHWLPRLWYGRYDWTQAKHLPRFVENPPEQDFYGSMDLAEERGWYVDHHYGRIDEDEPSWLAQTAAGLSPEALAHAPWDGPWPSDDREPEDSGPGNLTSLAPGPDWLDRQLATHVAWVARMAPIVTGWSVAA